VDSSAVERAQIQIARWRADPIAFVREQFCVEPDPWQAEALAAFPTTNRIAMKACKGPGKTALLAWLVWNFIATRPFPKIAATSISKENLGDNLWTELAKWQKFSPWLRQAFVWTKTRIVCRDHPEEWWASARSWSRSADSTQQADTLAGLHADYLLFVLDESGGIPDAVMAAADAALSTGIECKIIQAGNPTQLSGPLYRAATNERDLWHLIEITGDPDDPKRSSRISVEWAREQIKKWGANNPWVLVNVFGRFPPTSLDSLLGPDDVSQAMARTYSEDAYNFAAKILGVDAARFGDDPWVIFPRQGLRALPPTEMRGPKTQEAAAGIIRIWDEFGADACFPDDTGGWAAGAIDALEMANYKTTPINFSGKALDRRYYNKRSEMIWLMCEWVKAGGWLPNDPELTAELTAYTYWLDGNQLRVVEKDQVKALIGRSPNKADALALTFAQPVKPRESAPPPDTAGLGSGSWMS
jgi:phage terminase large subunit